MLIQLAVFDMAGTTVASGDTVAECLEETLRLAGAVVTRAQVHEVMGLSKPVTIRRLLESTRGTTGEAGEVARLHDAFVALIVDRFRRAPAIREIAGAGDLFRTLKRHGVSVALDTGFSRPIADVLIDRLGWARDDLLDASVTSDEVSQGRPHAEMIVRAMALTGVRDAGAVAKIGDTPADLQEGRAAGCGGVIGVTCGTHTRSQLEVWPHTHLVESLRELPAILLAGQEREA